MSCILWILAGDNVVEFCTDFGILKKKLSYVGDKSNSSVIRRLNSLVNGIFSNAAIEGDRYKCFISVWVVTDLSKQVDWPNLKV
jgi:hypothetical protein